MDDDNEIWGWIVGAMLVGSTGLALVAGYWRKVTDYLLEHHVLVTDPIVTIPGTENAGLDAFRLTALAVLVAALALIGRIIVHHRREEPIR